jgi:hypothetical protein
MYIYLHDTRPLLIPLTTMLAKLNEKQFNHEYTLRGTDSAENVDEIMCFMFL